MKISAVGRTIPEVTHHRAALNGTNLHYVRAGNSGSPILLVHGWPESWWAFHKLIPILAKHHRVYAVDVRGFGDSDIAIAPHDNAVIADDLHALIKHLNVGPVHVSVQDCTGPAVYRLAATYPEDLLSLIAVETGLPGYGLELLGNPLVAWYIGVLVKTGAADTFFRGRERELFGNFVFPSTPLAPAAVSEADIEEFARTFSRHGGWEGAHAIYSCNLTEGAAITALVAARRLTLPTLAIGHGNSDFTLKSISNAHSGGIVARNIQHAGHYIAMEAPEELANAQLEFISRVNEA